MTKTSPFTPFDIDVQNDHEGYAGKPITTWKGSPNLRVPDYGGHSHVETFDLWGWSITDPTECISFGYPTEEAAVSDAYSYQRECAADSAADLAGGVE